MRVMMQLIKKDLLCASKVIFIAPLLLFFSLVVMSGNTFFSYSLSIGLIGYFLSMYANFGTRDSEKTQGRLLLSLPVTRRSVIDAKYVLTMFWWVYAFIIEILFAALINLFQKSEGFAWLNVQMIVFSLCITWLLSALFYPFFYKFGYRVASFLGIIIFFTVPAGIGLITESESSLALFQSVMGHPLRYLCMVTFIIVIISYTLSRRFYQQKNL